MIHWDRIRESLSWPLCPWLVTNLQFIWQTLKLKLAFVPVAVTLALSVTVQAGCPDFTTYSQVS